MHGLYYGHMHSIPIVALCRLYRFNPDGLFDFEEKRMEKTGQNTELDTQTETPDDLHQLPRPDPRTQTAEEYAKMSIDLFFRAVKQTREDNRHKPVSPSTEAMYRTTAAQLEERHGSLESALQWLKEGEGQSMRRTTFSNYRSAIRFMAEQRMDTDLLMAVMNVRQDPTRARKFSELKTKRDKSPSIDDFTKIGEWLYSVGMENVRRAQRSHLNADPAWPVRTYALLMATYYCGLRPVEWEKATLITKAEAHGQELQPFLRVVTAKTHYGKVSSRDIPLSDIDDDAMAAIRLHMNELRDFLASESGTGSTMERASQYMRHCQVTLRKAAAAVFPKRKRSIQTYSARHACGARWTASGISDQEVAYLMGNSTIALKQQYGGSRKKGGAHERALAALAGDALAETGNDLEI